MIQKPMSRQKFADLYDMVPLAGVPVKNDFMKDGETYKGLWQLRFD